MIGDVVEWLIGQALAETSLEEMFEGTCERLQEAGIPVARAHITFRVLHPLYEATGLTWRPGGVEKQDYAHRSADEPGQAFSSSPLFYMINERIELKRWRLDEDEEACGKFSVLADFREEGLTDYFAYLIYFGGGPEDGVAGSWATKRKEGFTDEEIEELKRVQKRLGVACKLRVKEQIALNVVSTYLGNGAGRRVLQGQIQRGDGESIRAAIWYSDMRGSTRMADTLPRDTYINTLNEYFECTGGAVRAEGGEVLGFIGDAVLAIFPFEDGDGEAENVCAHVLEASRKAQSQLEHVNKVRKEQGKEPLSFGLALHLGDVVFGNIGLPERVSFSVIGPTVNEVARIEALTKELHHDVLASSEFARHTSINWEKLGSFELRGVGEPVEIVSPADG
ncbi:MAG: adenylate/guanylate cyclase domain-containing protein [Hyphomicrobiales bacterium]